MPEEKIFSAHQHLDAIVSATAVAFEESDNSSDLVVAGILRAVQARLKYLNDIVNLRGDSTDAEYMCILLQERASELAIDNDVLHDTIHNMEANMKEMETKLAFIKRVYRIEVKNI